MPGKYTARPVPPDASNAQDILFYLREMAHRDKKSNESPATAPRLDPRRLT